MNKLIGITLGVVLMASGASADEPKSTHSETLEKEHKDPHSLASQLPKDIVDLTKKYLKGCPVLTIESGILDEIMATPRKDLSNIDKAKGEILKDASMQTTTGNYIFKANGVDYVYKGNGVAASASGPSKSLKDVLREDNPKTELKGVLVGMDEQPNQNGQMCLYEGSKTGSYYFNFQVIFRGNEPMLNRMVDTALKDNRAKQLHP